MKAFGFWPFGPTRVTFGRRAEILGGLYLRKIGYQLLASPYRAAEGEIDIVARDGDWLVFIEVKARRRDTHPEDAVNRRKQKRIIRTARAYRSRYGLGELPYRFDILAVRQPAGKDPVYRLIQDAFHEGTGSGF